MPPLGLMTAPCYNRRMSNNKQSALNRKRYSQIEDDEYYTPLSAVDKEVPLYAKYLKGASVYCPCDNPFYSAFIIHLVKHFNAYRISKLVATCFKKSGRQLGLWESEEEPPNPMTEKAYHLEVTHVPGKPASRLETTFALAGNFVRELEGNGDWASLECLGLLEGADVVITNPPFSQLDTFVQTLFHYKKDFLIIAPTLNLTHKGLWPLYMAGRLRVGKNWNNHAKFLRPDGSLFDTGTCCWLTSMDCGHRAPAIPLMGRYRGYEGRYPCYDGTKVLAVSRQEEIPLDYYDLMAIPTRLIGFFPHGQFELYGMANAGTGPYDYFKPRLRGKNGFTRLIVRRRLPGRPPLSADELKKLVREAGQSTVL